ncbi:hypothetical protein GIB67_039538, partial [Kingdonia uniflora]
PVIGLSKFDQIDYILQVHNWFIPIRLTHLIYYRSIIGWSNLTKQITYYRSILGSSNLTKQITYYKSRQKYQVTD